MPFVPDASATLPWCFLDETSPESDALLLRLRAGEEAIVPAHWPTEVMNGLLVGMRRGRVSLQTLQRFLEDLSDLYIQAEPASTLPVWRETIRLAEQHKLSVYDAAYLELAHRIGLPLATRDQELRRAALASGVELEPA